MSERSLAALQEQLDAVDDVAHNVDDEALLQQMLAPVNAEDMADPQTYLDWENPDHQSLVHHLHDLTHRAAQLLAGMNPLERAVALQAAKGGRSYTAIAEAANASAATVSKYLRDTTHPVHKYVRTVARKTELAGVPVKAHRLQMAWRIAQRLETQKPDTALKALNLIAQQAGEMQRDKEAAAVAPTVVLAQFNFTDNSQDVPKEATGDTVDGVYQVVDPE